MQELEPAIPKVLIGFGTRPELIKLGPLIRYLKFQLADSLETYVVFTGQHQDLVPPLFSYLGIEPNFSLGTMHSGSTLSSLTCAILKSLSPVLQELDPDLVIVHGDTVSSMSIALAAFYERIPICHIEAGLRSHSRYHPFPEEVNRRLITQLSTFHFATDESSMKNLLSEGLDGERVFVAGNLALDSLTYALQNSTSTISDLLGSYDVNEKLILVTQHRREHIGERVRNTCLALKLLSEERKDCRIYYQLHPNPLLREAVEPILEGVQNIVLFEPMRHDEFIGLLSAADLVITDSGGLSEEAGFLEIPTLILRNFTERQYLLESPRVKLVESYEPSSLAQEIGSFLSNIENSRAPFSSLSKEMVSSRIANDLLARVLPQIML